jgi:two-component system KDP operon response regulator KdpE
VSRVLVVDDEPAIQRAISTAFSARGYEVRTAAAGGDALSILATDPVDLVILDLGLPDLDGVEVCKRLRSWTDVPVIVLSAQGSDSWKVAALDGGADDYVTKPFSMPELLARVRVALRRGTPGGDAVLTVDDLVIDIPRRVVTVDGREVALTPKEFAFLALLARWPGRVLTHRTILQEVWGPEYSEETHYLRVYASQIRKKLGEDHTTTRVQAEPGVGYRLAQREDGEARAP